MSEFDYMLDFCKDNNVEQLTIRRVDIPIEIGDHPIAKWTSHNLPDEDTYAGMESNIKHNGIHLSSLMHGAEIFDYAGQNVCLSTCLTDSYASEIRQLISFPDGHVRSDWKYTGAIVF